MIYLAKNLQAQEGNTHVQRPNDRLLIGDVLDLGNGLYPHGGYGLL